MCWLQEIRSYASSRRLRSSRFESAVGYYSQASTLAKSAQENNLGVDVLLAASPIGYSLPLDGLRILSGAAERLAEFGGCYSFTVTGLASATNSTNTHCSRQGPSHSTHLAQPLGVGCFQP